MFKRKTVIFKIEKENKIVSEFSENITILYLKIYIRDRTNIKNFDLYYKGNLIKNNNIPIHKFCKSKTDKTITFYLKSKICSESNRTQLSSNNNIKVNYNIDTNRNKNQEKFKFYEDEITLVKEKNNQLINNINQYKANINECLIKENKNKEKYNSIENLLVKQKEQIKTLKNKINEANKKYKILKNKSVEKENKIQKNKLKYMRANDNFAIISSIRKPKRCLSVESFNTFYLIKKNHAMKFINLTNDYVNSNRMSVDSTCFNSPLSNNQLHIFTNNINNIDTKNKKYENNFDIGKINNLNINSRNDKIKNLKNNIETDNSLSYSNESNINKYKYQIKEHNTNSNTLSNNNIINNKIINTRKMTQDLVDRPDIKEEDKIGFDKILKDFKIKDIKQLLTKEILESKYSLKMPDSYKTYYPIFKYLNNNEIFPFSLTNKTNNIVSLTYWLNYLENKIIHLNDAYNKLATRYNSLTQEINTVESKSNSILSLFSKSGLKVLNSPHYLDIFNNPIEYFTKDNIFLFIYKMLFLFINLYDEKNNLTDEDFIGFMVNEIKIKTKEKQSLKEYIYNLLDNEVNFSFENVMSAKKIMNFYKIENIEGNQLTKIDRATTIIGYVVRDLMGFTGLGNKTTGGGRKSSGGMPANKINKKVEEDISHNSLKNKIINVCEKIDIEKNKCQDVILKIKELILKYYNV